MWVEQYTFPTLPGPQVLGSNNGFYGIDLSGKS